MQVTGSKPTFREILAKNKIIIGLVSAIILIGIGIVAILGQWL